MTSPFPCTAADLAKLLGRTVAGDANAVITGVNSIELAQDGDVTFLGSDTFAQHLPTTGATCVIVREKDAQSVRSAAWIVSPNPYADIVTILRAVSPLYEHEPGHRDPRAVIDDSAFVAETASIGPGCVITAGCEIGENTQLLANVVLYPRTRIGRDCTVNANTTCYQDTLIGDRCIIHAGAVIGSDGFGYVEQDDKHFEKIPHVGSVCIGNDVEIGANVTIDRAAMGQTVIEDGVKIDNLVQLAHGVRVGENSAIAAQVAIAGGTVVGRRNRIAGQAGIVGHVVTTDDVVVYAQSGVAKSITAPGAYFGSPAKEHAQALRMEMALRQLPELLHQIRTMAAELEALKKEHQQ
ncbi:MAG: UDP-3-O-(3-hydroxymyristoyl)glucosamine N-acyltransferase [Candidatus Kapabacteria bacterium]|nr:UDP-3-O-(3-hydroxymyristoyl)glucosamine N-acyltransferase [Candidatus Kapabacteria bacterium]